jgi:hypothetical protein
LFERTPGYTTYLPETLEAFQKKILAAYENKDIEFLNKLYQARRLRNRPAPAMNALRAAVLAFDELFLRPKYTSRKPWPTKKAVRELAEKILMEAGHAPINNPRYWPKIFRKAGLWELPAAK